MMRYLLIILMLVSGCEGSTGTYTTEGTIYVDSLPECPAKVTKSKKGYISLTRDNGDILYVAKKGPYACLKRNHGNH